MNLQRVILEVVGRSHDAQRSLHELGDEIRDLPNARTVTVKAEVRNARRNIKEMRDALRDVDRSRVSPEVNVQITQALLELDTFDAKLRAIPNNKVVDIEVRRGILSDLAAIERGFLGLTRGIDRASRPARTLGDQLHTMVQTVKQVTPVINGLAIILGTKLLPALLAVAGSAASAAGGLGLLVNALAVGLGPALGLVVAAVVRLTKVFDALKAQDQARDAASRKTVEGSQAAAAAEDRRRQAANAVRDALQSLTSAERGLAEARRVAAEAIKNANIAVLDSERDLAAAAADLRRTQVDAFRAIEDAAERASDAIRGITDAELGVEDANLALAKARNELADIRKESGLAGNAFDRLFRRFSDVDIDLDRGALLGLSRRAGLGADQQLELEEAINRLRHAEQNARNAKDALSDAQREATRAQQDNNKFVREGIRAYEPYLSAVERHEQAARQLAVAQAESNRLEQLGIANAPAVVAAHDSVRDAEERLAEARRQRKQVAQDDLLSSEAAKAKQLTDDLTASERGLLESIKAVRTELSGFFRPAVDLTFGALARALAAAPGQLNQMRDAFTRLGGAFADTIDNFTRFATGSNVGAALAGVVDQSAALVRILGTPVFLNFLTIMGNLAQATLPLLLGLLAELGVNLGKAAGKTKGLTAANPVIQSMVQGFRIWVGLIGAVGDAFLAIAEVVGPIGNEFVKWISEGVKGFAKWTRSEKGRRDIKRFFDDTIPVAKEVIKLIVKIGITFLRAFQVLGPVLKPTVQLFEFLFDVLNFVLGLLGKIPAPIREIIGWFLGFAVVIKVLRAVYAGLVLIGGKAWQAIKGIFEGFVRVVAAVKKFLKIASPSGVFLEIGRDIVNGVIRGVRGLAGALFNAAKAVLLKVVSAARSLVERMPGLARSALRAFLNGVRAFASIVVDAGASVLRFIVRGIRSGFELVKQAAFWVYSKLKAAFSGIWERLKSIGTDILNGIVRGIFGAFGALKRVASAMIDVVKRTLGIHSPSKAFEEVGKYMMLGLVRGFEKSVDLVNQLIEKIGGDEIRAQLGAELTGGRWFKLEGKDARRQMKAQREAGEPVTPWVNYGGTGIKLTPGGLLDVLRGGLQSLASGGVTRGESFARIGEAGREAVLPLTRAVFREMARAIVAQLGGLAAGGGFAGARMPALAGAGGRATGGGINIEKVEVLPPAGGGALDPQGAGAEFALELTRRGYNSV